MCPVLEHVLSILSVIVAVANQWVANTSTEGIPCEGSSLLNFIALHLLSEPGNRAILDASPSMRIPPAVLSGWQRIEVEWSRCPPRNLH